MKYRWIPVMVLLSILFGVILGIRIHDFDSIFLHKEKQLNASKTESPNNQKKNSIVENKTFETKDTNNQEESKEVFLNTDKKINTHTKTNRSMLSKMGKNIDNGVSAVFSKMISKMN